MSVERGVLRDSCRRFWNESGLYSDYHVSSPDLILSPAKAIGRSCLRSRKRARANASNFARVLASPRRSYRLLILSSPCVSSASHNVS